MAELYFLVGNLESEKARMLVKKSGLEITIQRVEPDEAYPYFNKGIKEFPFLNVGDITYFGLDEIRSYIKLQKRQDNL